MIRISLAAVFCLSSAPLFAQAADRLDIFSRKAALVISEEGTSGIAAHATWVPEEQQPRSIYAIGQGKAGEWTEHRLRFTPSEDDTVSLICKGPYLKDAAGKLIPVGVYYDNITINGQELPNGSFENGLTDWRTTIDIREEYPAELCQAPGLTPFGEACVLVWHNSYVSTSFPVKKDQPVELSLFFRSAGDFTQVPFQPCFLDLRPAANMGFADEVAGDGKGGWSDQGPTNDLREMPTGLRSFEGMEFSVIDPTTNGGRSVLTFASEHFPNGLTEARVDVSADAPDGLYLYLLHGSCWSQAPKGAEIGTVTCDFQDGTRQDIPVRSQINVSDWWLAADLPNGKVVFRQKNNGQSVGIYMSRFHLPGKPIRSVTFTGHRNAIWIVVAATVSSKRIVPKESLFEPLDGWAKADIKDLQVKEGTALDLSYLVEEGPAGKHGRAMVAPSGQFVFEQQPDREQRFFGFNWFGFNALVQKRSPEEAKQRLALFARLMHRQGYNILRPLCMDSVLMQDSEKDLVFNPRQLDYVDFLLAELKKQGVYTFFTIGGYRLGFQSPSAFQLRNDLKALMTCGDEKTRRYWRSIAEQLLNHVNPYTGVAWKDEPAIICVEYYNEQELCIGRLDSLQEETLEALRKSWHAWLAGKYRDVKVVNAAWGDASRYSSFDAIPLADPSQANAAMSDDWYQWFIDISRECQEWCHQVVRATGYRGPLSQYNVVKSMGFNLLRSEGSSVVAMNSYFCHPSDFSRVGSRCGQFSSVEQLGGYWRSFAATRIAGRPLVVTEHNHAFWNQYQHEDGPLFSAYSALQGFAGVMIHSEAVMLELDSAVNDFNVGRSPVARANEFIAAHFFARRDVRTSPHRVDLLIPQAMLDSSSARQAVSSNQNRLALLTGFALRFPESGIRPDALPTAEPSKADMSILPAGGAKIKTEGWFVDVVESNDGSFDLNTAVAALKSKGILPMDNLTDPAQQIFQSDTGQITLRNEKRLLKVMTDFSEAVTVDPGAAQDLAVLSVKTTSIPATVALVAVDGKPLAAARRLVLVYNTAVMNSDSAFSEDRVVLKKLGRLPVLMQTGVLQAELHLSNPGGYAVYPLHSNGERREKLPVDTSSGVLGITLDTATLPHGPTPFFEIVAE